jgi:hypothetical protein
MLITVPEGIVAADMDLLAPLAADDEDAEDEADDTVAGLGAGATAVEGVMLALGATLVLAALVMKLML